MFVNCPSSQALALSFNAEMGGKIFVKKVNISFTKTRKRKKKKKPSSKGYKNITQFNKVSAEQVISDPAL